jgi:hypothetical protein
MTPIIFFTLKGHYNKQNKKYTAICSEAAIVLLELSFYFYARKTAVPKTA